MKNKINFLIIILLLGISFNASATKWRVNKGLPLSQVNFNELKIAVEDPNVLSGDTIYVEGNSSDYEGGITILKKLIIIGPGYFLNDEDLQPTLCSHLPAPIGGIPAITISGQAASGTVITGLSFSNFSNVIIVTNTSEIYITRNKIAGNIVFPSTNISSDIFITRNIIRGSISISPSLTINNLNITNNLILGDIAGSLSSSSEVNLSTVRNNTFSESSEIQIEGSVISYNYVGSIECDPLNIVVENNIISTSNNCYINSNGNVFNPYSGNFDFLQDNWTFDESSDNTTTHGAYNGSDPYYNNNPVSIANLPAWPVIYDCEIQSDGDSTLQVIFNVRSNN